MSNPVFWKKKENVTNFSFADLAKRVVKVKSMKKTKTKKQQQNNNNTKKQNKKKKNSRSTQIAEKKGWDSARISIAIDIAIPLPWLSQLMPIYKRTATS